MQQLIIILTALICIVNGNVFDLDPRDGNQIADGPDTNFTLLEEYIIKNTSLYTYDSNPNVTYIYGVVLDDSDSTIFIDINNAKKVNRLASDFSLSEFIFESVESDDVYLDSIKYHLPNHTSVRGIKFSGDNVDRLFVGIFNSIYFMFGSRDFVPRTVCLIAELSTPTVGCTIISYIGTNDNPVELLYEQAENLPTFVEDFDAIPILNGNLTVLHDDHPSFLLHNLTITLHQANNLETLNLTGATDYDYKYERTDGNFVLTMTNEGTPAFYKQFIENVVYNNFNQEPLTRNRTLTIGISDGLTVTNRTFMIRVINTNDAPIIIFNDTTRLTNYIEGTGLQLIDPQLSVLDEDIESSIMSVRIQLYSTDTDQEFLYINKNMFPTIQIDSTPTSIIINESTGEFNYTRLLRSLAYRHSDSDPGNPTFGSRMINFTISDGINTTQKALSFIVLPVNDAPIIQFVDNITVTKTKFVKYVEEDQPLYFASNVNLSDVDSVLSAVEIKLYDLFDGSDDVFHFNETLISGNVSFIQNTDITNNRLYLLFFGQAPAATYEKILQSIYYINNNIEDNTITTGNRTVIITANDTFGAKSEPVNILIDVQTRNDEPELEINEVLLFTEDSVSVEIATPHILSLMDEEENGISQLNVSLLGLNGPLDSEDRLILRTKQVDLLNTLVKTKTHISTSDHGTLEEYEEFLRSIRYINDKDQPTYYVNGSSSNDILKREITITITDDGLPKSTSVYHILINITLVNDVRPVITIDLLSTSCIGTHPITKASKRDTSSFNRLYRRLQSKRRTSSPELAPMVLSSYIQFSSENDQCISSITTEFAADTNAPPVEVKRDLSEIITIVPFELNSYISHGEWVNRRTLVIFFSQCYRNNETAGMKLVFDAVQGKSVCNATSVCMEGICFRNETGCPFTGYSSISLVNPNAHDTPSESLDTTSQGGSTIPYILILSVVFVLVITMLCLSKLANKGKQSVNDENNKVKSSLQFVHEEGNGCSSIDDILDCVPLLESDIKPTQETIISNHLKQTNSDENATLLSSSLNRKHTSSESLVDKTSVDSDQSSHSPEIEVIESKTAQDSSLTKNTMELFAQVDLKK